MRRMLMILFAALCCAASLTAENYYINSVRYNFYVIHLDEAIRIASKGKLYRGKNVIGQYELLERTGSMALFKSEGVDSSMLDSSCYIKVEKEKIVIEMMMQVKEKPTEARTGSAIIGNHTYKTFQETIDKWKPKFNLTLYDRRSIHDDPDQQYHTFRVNFGLKAAVPVPGLRLCWQEPKQ
jgi:hypothetical protein